MFNLEGKIAVVTGAGSGIGKAVDILLAKQGAMVYVADINEEQANETVKEIGNNATAMIADLSNQEKTKAIFAAIPNLDILVNSAGVSHIGTAESTEEADFDRLYNVNVKGVYNCLHAAIPKLKAKGGVIVNMCSIAATLGIPDRFAY